jgi:hypothetical protein
MKLTLSSHHLPPLKPVKSSSSTTPMNEGMEGPSPSSAPSPDEAHHGTNLPTGNSVAPEKPLSELVPSIRFIPYVTETLKGLNFPIVERKVPNGKVLKVKRFVEKGNLDFSDSVAFKSKVVSRQHGEVWTEGMHVCLPRTLFILKCSWL